MRCESISADPAGHLVICMVSMVRIVMPKAIQLYTEMGCSPLITAHKIGIATCPDHMYVRAIALKIQVA